MEVHPSISSLITPRPRHNGDPCSPERGAGPPLPQGQGRSGGHREPTETLSTMLIKHENAISWLINQGKTPPFISEQNPKAFYKHVTCLSVNLKDVVKCTAFFYYLTSVTSSFLTTWQMSASCFVPKYTETVMRKQRLT